MATKPNRKAFGRSLSDFPRLSKLERDLIEHCRIGKPLVIGDGTRPEKPTIKNKIRPELIRFLLLGGDADTPVHESGVRLTGVWIEGNWSISSCNCKVRLGIQNSTINGRLLMQDCILPLLDLSGSSIKGIGGDRATLHSGLLLRDKFKTTHVVSLIGAQIGGNLSFRNSSFESNGGDALILEGAVIKGSIFLDEGLSVIDSVYFLNAEIGALIDDPKLLKGIILDGLTYRYFSGNAPTDAATRIAWLNKQPRSHLYQDFRPQPWEQLIKVLRSMGHKADADIVAIAKQDQLYKAGKITGLNILWHKLYGWLAGYGYRPSRTLAIMLFVWVLWAVLFDFSKQSGWMAPSSPIIHTNQTLIENCEADAKIRIQERDKFANPNDAKISSLANCRILPNEYTTFNPLIYSLDLILPLVDLEQENDWSPMVLSTDHWFSPRPLIRLAMWFEILFGWMASLLLVAVLSNLVKKD